MKRYVFKWSAVLSLLIISVICVYLYSNLPVSVAPDGTPSTPVVGTPQEGEANGDGVIRTEFPKAPLLSPFSGCDFLVPLSGSGDDTVLELYSFGGHLYAVGETDSPDYDFCVSTRSVFVAKLSDNGSVLNIVTAEGKYLHSKLAPFGIGVLTASSAGTVFTVFDFDLDAIATTSCSEDTSGMTVLTNEGLAFVSTPSSALVSYSHDTKSFGRVALPSKISEAVALECIGESVYLVANTQASPVIVTVNGVAVNTVAVNTLQSVQSAIPFYDNGLGFTLSGLNSGVCSVCAVFSDGEVSWTKRLFQAEKTELVPISDGYLLFASLLSSSTCMRLCSHGDVVESCVLNFTNLIPCEYLVGDGEVTILFASSEQEKSTVATYSVADGAQFFCEFDTSPKAIIRFGEGITLGVSTSLKSGNFSSGVGATDSFILRLI